MLARVELAQALAPERAPDTLTPTLTEAVTAIETRAATLANPLRRNNYLGRPHLVVSTLALARTRS